MVTVKIYSTPSCHWCSVAKKFFKDHNIEYEEIDVQKDHEAREEMIKKSGQRGVPVIIIGDKVLVGYHEDAVREMLNL